LLRGIKKQLSIPVSVKLSSDYTNILHFAKRLDETGIDGMVLFNAFFQPDVDIWHERHRRAFNLSHKGEYKKSLRYAGMLYGRIKADVCSSHGIFSGEDVIKLLLTGASCVQVVSAVYRQGIERIGEFNREISEWMEKKQYSAISQFRESFPTVCSTKITPCSSIKGRSISTCSCTQILFGESGVVREGNITL